MGDSTQKELRVMVLGLRGIPNIQGGVETHAENLYPILSRMGCNIDLIARSPYVPPENNHQWQGIRIHRIWSPRQRSLEAIVHSFLGTIYAALHRPDILHIHAIGPALFTPLAKIFGLRVIVTHHGPDYDRQKWGRFGRLILLMGESLGMRFANQRIVISQVIKQIVYTKYGCDAIVIPNGVNLPTYPETMDILNQFGLERSRYVLLVSRLVPEKRHLDLIEAFKLADMPGWKLAIVGSSDHPDSYVNDVVTRAEATPNVVMTGFQSGVSLQELYAHAGLFVLPSSHEGLPIALLEALSYGLPVMASDIPANRELALEDGCYFPLGDVSALSRGLMQQANQSLNEARRDEIRAWLQERFNWERIAEETLAVYSSVIN